MSRIEIRPARETDLDAITLIYAEAVTNGTASYELKPPSRVEMLARFTLISEAGYPWLVAERQGEIVGYAYASAFRPRPAYRFIVENSIYVAVGNRGRGIGRLLLQSLLAETETLGFRQMIAVIGDGHAESPSVRLHESLGFRHSGRLVGSGYKHGRWLDTVFMQYAMNGGAETPPDPGSFPERKFHGG